MNLSSTSGKTRKKAVWGQRLLIAIFLGAFAVTGNAAAGPGSNKGPKKKQHHSKLDRALNDLADGAGETDVIVEFFDDSDSINRISNNGGRAGRKLGLLKARAARVPNVLLKKLADDSKVKRVHLDRDVTGDIARTTATVGAMTARLQYGYSGAGIGVAVIDSGITNFHDDLTIANRSGQRVTAFVDFVNGRTSKYDDWGHGTHVAGIIAGNGYDSGGARVAIAPKANIVALKALDGQGRGKISYIIAALDWAITNRVKYNIRVINMSLGAGVFESYYTDPLTLAAKRAVDAGIVVVAAAGNMGRSSDGRPQYGAIGAPGNAPWVLTVGASSTEGTNARYDDKIASYSSRGPTMIDHAAKPDLVAPGSGTVSLAVKDSLLYITKSSSLVGGVVGGLTSLLSGKPYLTLSGTSMATPVVAGTVALMLEANPKLTPNMVKAILQYTSQVYPGYDYLTQGAGFLNTFSAVKLSRYFAAAKTGEPYPTMSGWSRHILWGTRRISGGVLTPGGTAWANNIVWGDSRTPEGKNIVWGENCANGNCDNIVWGNNIVWGESADDNIVWGNNIVWGDTADDNIVWANNIVWGETDGDNIVWGNSNGDNIVWGNGSDDNIVWGNSSDDNIVWGNNCGGADCDNIVDTSEIESFDPTVWENLFEVPMFPTTTGGGAQ
jgi:serine protease AprX